MTKKQSKVLDACMVDLEHAIFTNNQAGIQEVYDTLKKEGLEEHANSIRDQFRVKEYETVE